MKIIAGNSFGSNIEIICNKCNCVYCVESKEDWSIRMVSPNSSSMKYKIPEYSVECPNCGYIKFLGFDPVDLIGTDSENTYCFWIPLLKERSDWKERYKIEPINC